MSSNLKGILLVDKEVGSSSFHLVSLLRRLTDIVKIGHAGTLDPFAQGLMVMLIGKEFTRKSDTFLTNDKEYQATLNLGITTDTFDLEGAITNRSEKIPSLEEIQFVIHRFQGEIMQTPPMYSAKKVAGKKLYDLARAGIVIEREPVQVKVETTLLKYNYPHLEIHVKCSKGTYIRSLAYDMGEFLGCGAHLIKLTRTRSGNFSIENAIPQLLIKNREFDITPHLRSQ